MASFISLLFTIVRFRLVEAGVNLRIVQQLMGHSCITQTARYAKATDKAMCDAMVSLEYGRLKALEESQTAINMQDRGGDSGGQAHLHARP